MSDFVWWTFFAILTLMLIVFTVRLCHRVLSDVFCGEELISYKETEVAKDLDDLTRYQTDFRKVFKDVECRDEADKMSMKNLLISNNQTAVEEIDELSASNDAIYEEDDGKSEAGKEESESLTEEDKVILEQIKGIQGKVDVYARKIPYCLGGKQHLEYFDINQEFLMNLINLNSIDCNNNDKLKKRKQMVSMYIQDCQNELKKKAEEEVFHKISMENLLIKKNQLSASNDAIYEEDDGKSEEEESDSLTEEDKVILEQIKGIQGEVDIYARKIPYCLGGKQHLEYFELNQQFLMNLINLNSIECHNNDKLKKRKQMVSMYIQDCQNELEKKAEE